MKYNFGIIEDPRNEEEKAQDYKHSDVYGAMAVNWVKKESKDFKKYTPRDQSTSLSCCGQGSAKGVETLINKVMSAHPPYRSRSNFPAGGMYTQDIGEVWKKVGSNFEELDQSQNQGETLLNRNIEVPTPYKIGGYIQPDSKSIEEVAQVVENYGHCMLIFHSNWEEWKEKPKYNGKEVNFGHCVCAVDYFLDENGTKCILIEDSAGLLTVMENNQRIITEDYLIKRCDGAIYFTHINPLEMPYVFTKTLKLGSVGFDVKKLQEKLGGLKVDGIFGQNTRSSVIGFQLVHGLVTDGIIGKKTNEALNKND